MRREKVKYLFQNQVLEMFQLCIPRTDEFICAYGDESMMLGCIAVQVDEECLFDKTSPMHVTMWMANM